MVERRMKRVSVFRGVRVVGAVFMTTQTAG